MASEEDRERHRKHIRQKQKEKKQRSAIARDLLTNPQYRQRKGKRKEDAEEKAYRKHRRYETEEDNEFQGFSSSTREEGKE